MAQPARDLDRLLMDIQIRVESILSNVASDAFRCTSDGCHEGISYEYHSREAGVQRSSSVVLR